MEFRLGWICRELEPVVVEITNDPWVWPNGTWVDEADEDGN